jgi:hypothetical protein
VLSVRGLHKDHNHDLKGLFKGSATMASARPGPFQDFYQAALAKGIKPTMARLTLVGSIAAIVPEARQDLSEAENPIRLKVRTTAEDPALPRRPLS